METFVVRVWSQGGSESGASPDGSPRPSMRGVVRHVGRGTESTFEGPEELVELLNSAGWTGRGANEATDLDQRRETGSERHLNGAAGRQA